METTEEVIDNILKASLPSDIFNISKIDEEFKDLARQIHPDICKHPEAAFAAAKLNELRQKVDKQEGIDEAGRYTINKGLTLSRLDFKKHEKLLIRSARNRSLLLSKIKENTYIIPYYGINKGEFEAKFNTRTVCFVGRVFPEEHVRWMLSRMLEFAAYTLDAGFIHGGINPDSMFFKPNIHGIQVASFYHSHLYSTKMDTISGKYKHWYPVYLFKDKKAKPNLDSYLAKKMAIYLLGDPSGSGTKLKRTVDKHLINFLLSEQPDSIEAFLEYKNVLKNYKTQWYNLNE
ncbi:MAG: hypothetical protein J5I47_06730 [Vicingus serpentipes]|nr:hypothetical protein [Vicingus serpentipes]